MAEFELTGLKELQEEMRRFPQKVERRMLNAALRKGAKLIVDAAKRYAEPHSRTGATAKMITAKAARNKMGYSGRVIIGVKHGKIRRKRKGQWETFKFDPYYWFMNEFGTSKQSAKPFLRPAFDQNAKNAERLIAVALRQAIDKEYARGRR